MTQGEQSEQPKRVAMILPHLGVGGAQRVAVMLANWWADQGLEVDLITLMDRPEDFYDLCPKLKRYTLVKEEAELRANARASRSILVSPEMSRFDRLRLAAEKYVVDRLDAKQAWATKEDASGRGRALAKAVKSRDIQSSLILLPLIFANVTTTALRQWALAVGKAAYENQVLGPLARAYLPLLRASFWRAKTLRVLLKRLRPDAVVSFLGATNIITIAASKALPTRIVISERNDPTRQKLDRPWQDLRPIIYPLADVVTANSHGALESMESYCSKAQLEYVRNPIVFSQAANRRRTNSILFLGRLVPQKAPDILIEAFAMFAKEHPNWTLRIVGDGPAENELADQARHRGITDRVIFHGLMKDPVPLLTQSRIFALPSRFEGTPNALLEAMAAGLACVVSDASPGPLRLIEHGTNGLVVKTDDPEDLAAALGALARAPLLVEQFGRAACDSIKEFGIDRVATDWERLLFGDPASR
jgi:glycosyltransferase involved in cell wall biosynthesis